jgi:hypothetical protein
MKKIRNRLLKTLFSYARMKGLSVQKISSGYSFNPIVGAALMLVNGTFQSNMNAVMLCVFCE